MGKSVKSQRLRGVFQAGILLLATQVVCWAAVVELNTGETKNIAGGDTVTLNGGTGNLGSGGSVTLNLTFTVGTADGTTLTTTHSPRTATNVTWTNPEATSGKTIYIQAPGGGTDLNFGLNLFLLNVDGGSQWGKYLGNIVVQKGKVSLNGSTHFGGTISIAGDGEGLASWTTSSSLEMLTTELATAKVFGVGTTNGTCTINVGGAKNVSGTFAGILCDRVESTTTKLAIVKKGTGTWKLTGANTYTGLTTIQGGKIEIAGSAAYSGGFLLDGGDLDVTAGTVSTSSVLTLTNGDVTIANAGTSFTTTATGNSVVLTNGDLNVTNGATFSANGSGNIIKATNGSLILGDNVTFTANRIEVTNGGILMGTDSTVTANGGIPLYGNYNHVMSGNFIAPMTLASGTLSPAGDETGTMDIEGKLSLNGGKLVMDIRDVDDFDAINHRGNSYVTFNRCALEINTDELFLGTDFDLMTTTTEFRVNDVVPAANFDWSSLLTDSTSWRLYLADLAGGGQALRAYVIPEPASWLLLLFGGLLLYRKKGVRTNL